jgi:hypothetical protein
MAATYGRLTGKLGVCIRNAQAGRAEFLERRGLRAARRNADDHDHRPEGHPIIAAGTVLLVDVVASMRPLIKAVAPDRLVDDDSGAGA